MRARRGNSAEGLRDRRLRPGRVGRRAARDSPPGGPAMTPPYAHLPEHVVKALPKLTGKAARVLIAVASFMDRRGECRPGIETIGERAGIAQRNTVSAAIQELQRAGVLAVERRRRKSSRFAWRILDKAESAASRKQDAAESAARYAAESAAQKDTTEEGNDPRFARGSEAASGLSGVPGRRRGRPCGSGGLTRTTRRGSRTR